jgi:dihydroorotate dehydrogenase (NAD+) catalytic subunit
MVKNKQLIDLSVQLGPIKLANPVMTASGTCGYSFELDDFFSIKQLGGFVTKSVTLKPRKGNPPQRTVETPSGMLNSIGLANIGLERFCAEKIPEIKTMGTVVFVNIAEKSLERYVEVSQRISECPHIAGIELNISCPNVKEGGVQFGADPVAIERLVGAVKKACPKTYLIVKLTPSVTDITATADAAIQGGADALSLINTLLGMAIDIEKRKPILGNMTGGLSGPAIRPIAVRMVHQVYEKVAKNAGVAIIGIGGIGSAQDALEFIIAGASAVQVGTCVFTDPKCLHRILEGIEGYLLRHQMSSVSDLVGTLG